VCSSDLTNAGLLAATRAGENRVTVDMGPVRLDWRDIPLAREMNTLHLGVGAGTLQDAVGVNVGNPHAVFFVDDASTAPLIEYGAALEHDPLFPERASKITVSPMSVAASQSGCLHK